MIRIRQIKIDVKDYNFDVLKKKVCSILKISSNDINHLTISKKSIDARFKDKVNYVFEVDVDVLNEQKILKTNKNKDVFQAPQEKYILDICGTKNIKNRPVIIGSGPAGLFCGYMLLKAGFKPIILERGKKIEERVEIVNHFWETGELDENCNAQFGEGGAGTFSDGKLNTLVKDKKFRMKEVFNTFCKYGAPSEIMYENGPHIGTDMLRNVITNMRNDMIDMGASFKYDSCVTDIVIKDNRISEVVINENEKLPCDILILCTGHSARDTFKMLHKNGLNMENKPFAVGLRIIHPQEMININQYKDYHKILKPASYKLSYTSKKGRGVYSFCMCPGGYVVNCSSYKGGLVVNGMSNYKRDTKSANSAIVVTISSKDFGEGIFDGMKLQEKIEQDTFKACSGKIPVQLFKDFDLNKDSVAFQNVSPEIKGKYEFYNLNKILPDYISENLKEAVKEFDKKIKGFSRDDAILCGCETRTSSPVRIIRNDLFESNIKGIYPCGEGAGYAGGITTSAIDGIKIAEVICSVYKA